MKFTDRARGMYLEGIQQTDIKYSNLAGRQNNSQYSDPSRPQHVFVVWIDDQEIVDALKVAGFNVREDEDTFNDLGMRHFLQFKAYPKMRLNRVTGEEEQNPKIMMVSTSSTNRLSQKEFGFVDGSHVSKVDIAFHAWEYEKGKPPVAVLDELWCSVDEAAGGQNDDYFEEKYGHLRDYEPSEEGEVPYS